MFEEKPTHPRALVIAEVSANHLGNLQAAKDLIRAAQISGASFVKFQHYRPETITVRGDHPDLQITSGSIWDGQSLWDLYSEAMTPWEWTAELVETAKEVGIRWFSTPFDETAVDYLEEFDPSVYKIASFEIVDLPLIRYVGHTGKPMIISTGMASLEEIDAAVGAAEQGGATDITLLRTNSGYPAKTSEMDLAAIPFMRERWGYPVGLSDHTLGNTAAIVAATLGARVFEKHLTMARSDGGPDALFSSEPDELSTYVESINDAISSWGSVRFGPSEHEKSSLAFRPSLRAVRDIVAGEKITSENVQSVRPSGGLPPDAFSTIENWKTLRNISSGDPIALEDLSSG